MIRVFWHLKGRWHETMAARAKRRAVEHFAKAHAAFRHRDAIAEWL